MTPHNSPHICCNFLPVTLLLTFANIRKSNININTNSSLDLTKITSIIFFQYRLQFGKRIKELATYNSISYPLFILQLLQSPA